MQVLGMSESIGVALASGCSEYAGAGAIVLCFVTVAWLALVALLYQGMKQRRAIFEPNAAKAVEKVKMIRSATGPTAYSWLMSKYDAFGQAMTRGEWVDGLPEERVRVFWCICVCVRVCEFGCDVCVYFLFVYVCA
jgi:hypothetical protein